MGIVMRNWTIALNSKTSDGSILFSNFTITEHRVKKRPETAAKNMPTNLFCLSTIASPDPSSFFFSSFSEKFSSPCPSSTMVLSRFCEVKSIGTTKTWDTLYQVDYRTRTIISRGLYIFTQFFTAAYMEWLILQSAERLIFHDSFLSKSRNKKPGMCKLKTVSYYYLHHIFIIYLF